MKNLLFLLAVLCLSATSFAQSKSIENFYQQYKNSSEVNQFNLSGGLLKMMVSGEDKEDGNLLERVTNLRLMIMDDGSLVKRNDYRQLLKNLKKEKFEELMQIKDQGSSVDFFFREDGDMVTDVIISVHDEGGFILLSLEGLFKFSDLNDLNIDMQGAEHLKRLPEKKKDIPRA